MDPEGQDLDMHQEEDEEQEEEEEEEEEGEEEIIPSPFYNLKIPVPNYCDQCKKKGSLICVNCKTACYCCAKCQREHWESHKTICKEIKKMWTEYYKQEEWLKRCDDNFDGVPNNYFEDKFCIGNFWSLHETRDWCRSITKLAFAFQKYNSNQSLKQAILLTMKLLQYNHRDNQGMRDVVIHNFLSLGLDQYCYDFMRHWLSGICLEDSKEHLLFWGCDISEPLSISVSNAVRVSLHEWVGLFLVKYNYMKKCASKEAFQRSFLLGTHSRIGAKSQVQRVAGNELVLREIYTFLLGERFFANRKVKSSKLIFAQLKEIFANGENTNSYLWKAIVNPKPMMVMPPPSSYGLGTWEEVYFVIEYSFRCWERNPRALKFLKDMCMKKYGNLNYTLTPSRFP